MNKTPKVLDRLAFYADNVAVQIVVKDAKEAEKVKQIINMNTSLRATVACIGDRSHLVFVPFSAVAGETPESDTRDYHKKAIQSALGYAFSESALSEFLDAIDASMAFRNYAEGFDSLKALWNGMIDDERDPFISYVVRMLKENPRLQKEFVINTPRALTALFNAEQVIAYSDTGDLQSCAHYIGNWCRIFSKDYLKSINPFKKRGE